MSRLSYCIKCGEACETENYINKIEKYIDNSFFGNSGIQWSNSTYAVCVNEECERYGIMVNRVLPNPPKRKKVKK